MSDRHDEPWEDLLSQHLASELDDQTGRAEARFRREVLGQARSRGMIWPRWAWASAGAAAAIVGVVVWIHGPAESEKLIVQTLPSQASDPVVTKDDAKTPAPAPAPMVVAKVETPTPTPSPVKPETPAGQIAMTVNPQANPHVVNPPAINPPPANVAPTPVAEADVRRDVWWQSVDEGTVVLADKGPVRQIRQKQVERLKWTDAEGDVTVEVTVPTEEVVYASVERY